MIEILRETTFKVPKMDCPSEEQIIRITLEGNPSIKQISFDLNNRTVKVVHANSSTEVLAHLQPLRFDAYELDTRLVNEISPTSDDRSQRRTLLILLLINGMMFLIEIFSGLLADSMGLISDSLDMLADTLVYSISLYAVGRAVALKRRAASLSGWFQMLLAAAAVVEVVRRFIYGSEPQSGFMIGISALALAANLFCLWLIAKHRHGEVHMKASWIFSTNDVLANIGVILAGLIVTFTGSRYPDLVVGSVISILVFRGALSILRLARPPKEVLENTEKSP
ncbi:MAG: cation transporter [Deltaproteobacteria bacterium]|nr:cation transporter [Deltaproteobacteria bacterium]